MSFKSVKIRIPSSSFTNVYTKKDISPLLLITNSQCINCANAYSHYINLKLPILPKKSRSNAIFEKRSMQFYLAILTKVQKNREKTAFSTIFRIKNAKNAIFNGNFLRFFCIEIMYEKMGFAII